MSLDPVAPPDDCEDMFLAGETLLGLAGVGAWCLDRRPDGEKLVWSSRTREIREVDAGFRPSVEAALAFYPDDARAVLERAMEAAFERGEGWDLDLPFVTARGRRLWVRTRARVVLHSPRRVRIVGTLEDISGRKARAGELERLTLVVNRMNNAAILTDREGRTEWVNESFTRLSGYTVADLAGRNPFDLLHGPGTDPEEAARVDWAIRAGEQVEAELLHHRRDGRPYWVRMMLTPMKDEAGAVTGFLSIQTDISNRRRAEQAAADEMRRRAAAEELLRDVLETIPSGVVVYDREERFLLANRAYAEIYPALVPVMTPGRSMEEVIEAGLVGGMYVHEIAPDAPEAERKAWVRDRVAFIRAAGPSREFRNFDGRWLQARERRSPAGNLVCVRTDITKLKEAMRNLEVARDEARAAAEAKSRFIARMGHELRTPLNAIIGFGELLEEDAGLGAEQRERVRLIAEAGRHLLDLINDLLDLSRIEAGRIDLVDRRFELPALLGSSSELFGVQARRKRLELGVELAADLPREVRGDPTRLRQIVLNLLSNAVKFTPAGGRVVLRARSVEVAASPGGPVLVRIEVEDSGPGIPRERLGLLFREFERVTPSLEPGTGLGLAISARLAEVMGGRMGCESEVGRGSLFRVELPLAVVVEPSAPAGAAVSRGTSAPAEPLRVLVVDDVAANRVLARTLLASAGHRVELAEDGETAVAAVASGAFDLVLMDVQMPGVDGIEATRRIRALPLPRGRVPIIALTAAALPEQVEECLRAGMDAHLAKPIKRAELLDVLSRIGRREPGTESWEATRRALAELEEELGDGIDGLLAELAGEFRLARERLAEAITRGEARPTLRWTLSRLSSGGRMVGALDLAAASDRLFAALDGGGEPRQALDATLAAVEEALAMLERWRVARHGPGTRRPD